MPPIHLFPFYGLWGEPTPFTAGLSHGVDTLAGAFVVAHPGAVRHASRSFWNWAPILAEIEELPGTARIVLIGHSNGVHAATLVAGKIAPRRAVIVSLDATWMWPERPVPLGANVICALSVVGVENGSLVGHAALECAADVSVPIERIETDTMHVAIDDDPKIQAACLAFLDRAMKGGA